MFTGIVETLGRIKKIVPDRTNQTFCIEASFTSELKQGDSVSHNGVCLTIEEIDIASSTYFVSAIHETLSKTMLGSLQQGDFVNLERSLKPESRLDGHFVQGHVDTTTSVESVQSLDGSYEYVFPFHSGADFKSLIVPTGSICINGISLTVGKLTDNSFAVYIIPHTFKVTTMQYLKAGDPVNIEFDVLGKYVRQMLSQSNQKQQI